MPKKNSGGQSMPFQPGRQNMLGGQQNMLGGPPSGHAWGSTLPNMDPALMAQAQAAGAGIAGAHNPTQPGMPMQPGMQPPTGHAWGSTLPDMSQYPAAQAQSQALGAQLMGQGGKQFGMVNDSGMGPSTGHPFFDRFRNGRAAGGNPMIEMMARRLRGY